ncbi:hypothetical protein [Dendronalium phyllosphericum]|uniref:hypothetical protein n=1 Tax=Dendronalium phyllosphericum TaxID=2840445 RepID=UPI001CEC9D37|nr:hypothetical protein [Dendronalium phyllosphericum]
MKYQKQALLGLLGMGLIISPWLSQLPAQFKTYNSGIIIRESEELERIKAEQKAQTADKINSLGVMPSFRTVRSLIIWTHLGITLDQILQVISKMKQFLFMTQLVSVLGELKLGNGYGNIDLKMPVRIRHYLKILVIDLPICVLNTVLTHHVFITLPIHLQRIAGL